MRLTSIPAAVAAIVVLLAGSLTACTSQKEPAERAVAKVETSLTELRADAEQYAAEELKDVEKSVARLKKKLAEKDYSGALQGAPAVGSSVASLRSTVERRKADAEELLAAAQQEWTELNASVPQLVDTLQKRVDSLTRSRRLPQGLDKAGFEAAKAEFENVKSSWAEATAEFSAGMPADAVRRARAAKAKGEWLVQKFGA
jgi:cytochrome c556